MFFKTKSESIQLLEGLDKGLDLAAKGDILSADRISRAYVVALDQAADMNNAARRLISIMDQSIGINGFFSGYRIALITEWGVWPSHEDWYLFYALRAANGEREQIHDKPGHIFLPFERDQVHTFFSLFLRSGWGCVLAGNADSITIAVDHDGNASIITHRPDIELDGALKSLGWTYSQTK